MVPLAFLEQLVYSNTVLASRLPANSMCLVAFLSLLPVAILMSVTGARSLLA